MVAVVVVEKLTVIRERTRPCLVIGGARHGGDVVLSARERRGKGKGGRRGGEEGGGGR